MDLKIIRMKIYFLLTLILSAALSIAQPKKSNPNKEAVLESVAKHQTELISISDKIWSYAETALKESKSSKELADYAEAQGFILKRGVAGMPTAFIAEYGSGKPIIGIMGEFDALPGISQKAQPTIEPLNVGTAGHGIGNIHFGTVSIGV